MHHVTDIDRKDSEDTGAPAELHAAAREAKAEHQTAWAAFCAYVEKPDHDTRGAEFAALDAERARTQAAADAAESAVCAAMVEPARTEVM